MKPAIILVTALVSISARSSFADECGPTASRQRLAEHSRAVLISSKNLRQHVVSIRQDIKRMRANSRVTSTDLSDMDFEASILGELASDGEVTAEVLLASSTIADIRDLMVDAKDKLQVNQELSFYLSRLKKEASLREDLANRTLRHITAPGIAVDVEAFRDQLAKIAEQYRDCEAPAASRR